MNRSLLLLSAAIASFAVACSSPASEDAASSDDALTGSLANAKACAVKDAYAAAQLSAFKTAAKTELPGVQQSASSALSKFEVKDVGTVFVSEEGATMSFYDANGALLAKAGTGGAELAWSQPNSAPLSCASQPPPPPVDPAAPTSCLATDPIDAKQFAYTPAVPAAAGKCTTQEITALSSYYTQHAGDATFDVAGWKASVSAGCSTCAFSDVSAPAWTPIITSSDGQIDVITGGCVGTVSKNADCGRAYQQYEDCTIQACLAKCTTQEEFTACRQDQAVLTTACQGAVTELVTVCGQDKVNDYIAACTGTSYTFEGPLKVQCVTGQ